MGKAILLVLAVAAVGAVAPAVAAGGLPYCIKGCDFGGGAGDCSFSSYQQCQATASGRDATCAANPYFNASAHFPKSVLHRRDAFHGLRKVMGTSKLTILAPLSI